MTEKGNPMGSVRFESAQPAYSIGGISRNDIQKCPEYFSDRMGGCVTSGAWLIEMFLQDFMEILKSTK